MECIHQQSTHALKVMHKCTYACTCTQTHKKQKQPRQTHSHIPTVTLAYTEHIVHIKYCTMLSTYCNKNASMSFQFFCNVLQEIKQDLTKLTHTYIYKLTHTSNFCTQVCLLFIPLPNTLLRYLTQVCLLFTSIPNTLLRYLTQVCLLFTPIPNMLLRYLTQVCLLFTPLRNTLLPYLTQVGLLFNSLPNEVKLLGSGSRDENTVEPVDWQWHTVEQHQPSTLGRQPERAT